MFFLKWRRERKKQKLLLELKLLEMDLEFQQKKLADERVRFFASLDEEGMERLRDEIESAMPTWASWRVAKVRELSDQRESIRNLEGRAHEIRKELVSLN